MDVMRKLLLACVLLLAGPVFSQQMPTDVDLKSAYCLKIKQRQADFLNSQMSSIRPETQSVDQLQLLKKVQRDYNSDVHRLQSYLLPKMTALDTTALAAATNRAEADLKEHAETINSNHCSRKCEPFVEPSRVAPKWSACMSSCGDEFQASVRIESCRTISWLPF